MSVLEMIDLAHRDHDVEHHGEAGVDRAGDEIGRENGRMPAGQLRDGKIETDDTVHRKDERRGESGEKQIGHLMSLPVRGGIAPAEREHAVKFLLPTLSSRDRARWRGRAAIRETKTKAKR